ncbi:hypothetical protein B0H13DRAFT_1850668 [Mycena leptocephala]|nr:hypothetical protein B0H13DRAFT_1850668 [Mycena leptocephala]
MMQKSQSTNLASHEFGGTFYRKFNASGKCGHFHLKRNNLKFTANIVAEIGSEEEGTWLAAYPKNWPANKLPITHSSSAYRMVLAARCPTDAPKEVEDIFRESLRDFPLPIGLRDQISSVYLAPFCCCTFNPLTRFLRPITREKVEPPELRRNARETPSLATPAKGSPKMSMPLFLLEFPSVLIHLLGPTLSVVWDERSSERGSATPRMKR